MEKQILNLPARDLPIKPLTAEEIQESAKSRVTLIDKEFSDGFNFIKDHSKSVTFFGSARFKEDNKYYKQTRSLAGRIVKELGYSVLTGGGPGIMEAANRGAFEAGGKSLGLTIEIPEGQVTNPYLTEHLDFYYFFSRKVSMSFSAEAYIFCPGGFGTMDELFEILTLVQTHKIKNVPIILLGSDFWMKWNDFMIENSMNLGLVDKADMNLYTITDSEEDIIEIIKSVPVKNGEKFHYPLAEA
jgi:uncharacterized protein (TIGR00730 family)